MGFYDQHGNWIPSKGDAPFCRHWTRNGWCGVKPARPFLVGDRCEEHTPAKVSGREDIVPDPALALEALRASAGRSYSYSRSDSALHDQRARDKGQAVSAARRKKWREAQDA
jgi:hypothetical protein